ncbi:YopX family protein [Paenibacillus sp. FSL R5-0527]|uniref:YopX family protein n=1 Tax=Paenibacillus sp. FSL R5-0527 TaxID=2975321 RepID=UPI0030FA7232
MNWNSGGPGGFTQQLEIDRKTAGQYTGRMTWDKKRIYEGDVLYFTIFDYDGGDTQHKGVVKWVDELASFILAESMDSNEGYWLYLVLDNDDSAEKIGNIHDNPELLEVQDQ